MRNNHTCFYTGNVIFRILLVHRYGTEKCTFHAERMSGVVSNCGDINNADYLCVQISLSLDREKLLTHKKMFEVLSQNTFPAVSLTLCFILKRFWSIL